MDIQSISHEKFKTIFSDVEVHADGRKYDQIFATLRPLLDAKCPFVKLDRIGKMLGDSAKSRPSSLFPLLREIVDYNTLGGHVIFAQALVSLLDVDFDRVIKMARDHIQQGATWYICDMVGERVIGQALHRHFEQTLPWLKKFLNDKDPWVRRSAGVAVHLYVKRNKTAEKEIKILLNIFEVHIEERQIDVVKGIGWGLKTVGRHHPDLMDAFLRKQFREKKKLSGLMLSKATTYLGKPRKAALEHYVRTLQA